MVCPTIPINIIPGVSRLPSKALTTILELQFLTKLRQESWENHSIANKKEHFPKHPPKTSVIWFASYYFLLNFEELNIIVAQPSKDCPSQWLHKYI